MDEIYSLWEKAVRLARENERVLLVSRDHKIPDPTASETCSIRTVELSLTMT